MRASGEDNYSGEIPKHDGSHLKQALFGREYEVAPGDFRNATIVSFFKWKGYPAISILSLT